jgi:hypothetical protein
MVTKCSEVDGRLQRNQQLKRSVLGPAQKAVHSQAFVIDIISSRVMVRRVQLVSEDPPPRHDIPANDGSNKVVS